MTEQPPSAIGTVAQEAARLIEDIATMARSSQARGDDPARHADEPNRYAAEPNRYAAEPNRYAAEPNRYDGGRARGPASPEARHTAGQAEDHSMAEDKAADPGSRDRRAAHEPSSGACSECGGERGDTPETCRLCPLCRGIALLRTVRPETVDLLADLALSLAASLRDVAMRSRASDPASSARPASGSPPEADRTTVQDIPVDDESEG
jgi:hypothetical protein